MQREFRLETAMNCFWREVFSTRSESLLLWVFWGWWYWKEDWRGAEGRTLWCPRAIAKGLMPCRRYQWVLTTLERLYVFTWEVQIGIACHENTSQQQLASLCCCQQYWGSALVSGKDLELFRCSSSLAAEWRRTCQSGEWALTTACLAA